MISQGFKDRVKDLLYNCYRIQCNKFITGSDTIYYINAQDQLGSPLSLTLNIDNNVYGYSVSPQFTVSMDGSEVVNKKLFMVDKIQLALDKAVAILKEVKSTQITSLTLETRTDNYILLLGGCSQGRSYLNVTYTIPYSNENGFIIWGNGYLHKIADILNKNYNVEFKVFDETKSVVTTNYLADFKFHLQNGEQKLLDDYILKTIISYDISLHSYDFTDPEIVSFLNELKYDLITYDDLSYIRDFYTVMGMIKF